MLQDDTRAIVMAILLSEHFHKWGEPDVGAVVKARRTLDAIEASLAGELPDAAPAGHRAPTLPVAMSPNADAGVSLTPQTNPSMGAFSPPPRPQS